MNLFGLTPIDAALSALGLNFAQLITDVLTKSSLAALFFIVSVLFGIARLIRSGNYRVLASLFLLTLAVIFLLFPHRSEGAILSAAERYGQSTQSSQVIKDRIFNYHQVPVLLTFVNQSGTAFFVGIIHALDKFVPQGAAFLSAPFAPQTHALIIREEIQGGIGDLDLRQDLNLFLYDHYLPALVLLKRDSPNTDIALLWPGDARINSYYSIAARRQWSSLESALRRYFDLNTNFSEKARSNMTFLTGPADAVDKALIKSVVNRQLNILTKTSRTDFIWRSSLWLLNSFPYVYGIGNLALAVFFPFLILMLVIKRNAGLLFGYLKALVWIKSWVLTAAVSSYFSLMMARLHPQTSDPSWVWEEPYYATAAAIALVILPFMTLHLIKQGG